MRWFADRIGRGPQEKGRLSWSPKRILKVLFRSLTTRSKSWKINFRVLGHRLVTCLFPATHFDDVSLFVFVLNAEVCRKSIFVSSQSSPTL